MEPVVLMALMRVELMDQKIALRAELAVLGLKMMALRVELMNLRVDPVVLMALMMVELMVLMALVVDLMVLMAMRVEIMALMVLGNKALRKMVMREAIQKMKEDKAQRIPMEAKGIMEI